MSPLRDLRDAVPAALAVELARRSVLQAARQRFLLGIPSEREAILRRMGEQVDTAHAKELRQRLDMARARARLLKTGRERPRRWLWAGCGFAAAAVAAVAVAIWLRPAPALTFTVDNQIGRLAEPLAAQRPMTMSFSDGSTLALESESGTRVLRLDRDGARVRLEQGALQARIVPRPHNRWSIEAGPFEVQVVGTQFRVAWDSTTQHFTLEMAKGRVRVRGPGLERDFAHDQAVDVWLGSGRTVVRSAAKPVVDPKAGDDEVARAASVPALADTPPSGSRLTDSSAPRVRREARVRSAETVPNAPASEVEPTRSMAPVEATAAIAPVEPPAASAPVEPPAAIAPASLEPAPQPTARVAPTATPSRALVPAAQPWDLATAGQYERALRAADEIGWTQLVASGQPAQLNALVTAARSQGRVDLAVRLLTSIRERFPATTAAADAAFALGTVNVHSLTDHRAAARWFASYLAERPSGPLAREAAGRLMESLDRSGQSSEACAAARHYLDAYPAGPHADYARRLGRACVSSGDR